MVASFAHSAISGSHASTPPCAMVAPRQAALVHRLTNGVGHLPRPRQAGACCPRVQQHQQRQDREASSSWRCRSVESSVNPATADVYPVQLNFPVSLPLLPFTPSEVLTPGSSKVLHLQETKFLNMLERVLLSSHQTFVHTVIEICAPGSQPSMGPGDFLATGTNGELFVFRAASLVKVLDITQSSRGVLVRVRAEGRVALRTLVQLEPHIVGVVVPILDDSPLRLDGEEGASLRESVQELRGVMQDIQNLAANFPCRETNNMNDAMSWVDTAEPVMRSTMAAWRHTGHVEHPWLTESMDEDDESGHGVGSSSSSSSVNVRSLGSSGGETAGEASNSSSRHCDCSGADNVCGDGDWSMDGAASTSSGASCSGDGCQESSGGGSGQHGQCSPGHLREPYHMLSMHDVLEAERACRLSFAALQVPPDASLKEKHELAQWRLWAMRTQDPLQRLARATQLARQARQVLTAKSALKSAGLYGSWV